MNNWLHIIQDCLFPPTCLLCGEPGLGQFQLCEPCTQYLTLNHPACPRCALPLPAAGMGECGNCLKNPPPFDRTFALFHYAEPVRHLIHGYKFRSGYAYGYLFGQMLSEALLNLQPKPELILPVPLHANRYSQRGYNQSLELARVLAKNLALPLDYQSLQRVRNTRPQVGLAAKDRKRNLKNAFALTGKLAAEHVVIVDDVITTGATVREIAKLLRQSGIKQIDVWACARAASR